MKKTLTILPAFLLCSLFTKAQTQVIPGSYTSVLGASTFLGPLANAARTYQLLIYDTLLTNLVGMEITGISFRSTASATLWPPATASFSDYDIYMGQSVDPVNRSLVDIALNGVGLQTKVRGGSLTINMNDYPAGGANSYGPVISFNTPYLYTGGSLLVDIRHTSFGSTSKSVDAIGTTNATAGYGTKFSAAWASAYSGAVAGMNGNFAVPMFTYQPSPLTVKLTDFTVVRDKENANLEWTTASEENLTGFVVEKSTDAKSFFELVKLQPAGQSNTTTKYHYTDTKAFREGTSVVYYRLKIPDNNGKLMYSKILVLKNNMDAVSISIHPNPVLQTASLSVHLPEAKLIDYTIYDIAGKIVKQSSFAAQKGDNTISLDLSSLAPGTYSIVLGINSGNQTLQFVKE